MTLSKPAAKTSQANLTVEALEERQLLSTVQIFAAGTTGQEQIELSIDGGVVATYSNLGDGANAGDFQTFTFNTANTIAADQVRIEFVNDLFDADAGIDRNVRIDAIEIDGVRFETESEEVFSTGTFVDADGVVPGFGRGDVLHANGFFQYAGEAVPVSSGVIALSGTVTAAQLNDNQWFDVAFQEELQDAIVVISPVSFNGRQPVHARVRNVTSTGFEFQFEEWDYLDGAHATETISWFAVERGVHTLADGAIIEAGSAQVGEQSVDIDLTGTFDGAPVVIGQVASENGSDPLVHRIDNVAETGFSALLQVEEAQRGVSFASQDFHYIAFSNGQFDDFATGTFRVDEDVATTSIATGYDGVVLADQQTLNGGDTAGLRITNQTDATLSLFVEEEASRETELNHVFETVGWVRTNQTISVAGSAAPTPAPTPAPTTEIAFDFSTSSDRSNPNNLAGATVSGDIFVTIGPSAEIDQVRFFLDDTSLSGSPIQTENGAPFDIQGGSQSNANPFDTTALSNGDHTLSIRVLLNDGTVLTETVTFTVDNVPATPTDVNAGTISLTNAQFIGREESGRIAITVERTGGSEGEVAVDFLTNDLIATGGDDFQQRDGTLRFRDGQTSRTINVTIADDSIFEGDETFGLTLSNPIGGAVLGAIDQATVTIVDDRATDGPATFYVSADGSDNVSIEQAQNRATPWQTIGRAIFEAQAGDTIIVGDGIYNEEIFLNESGTEGAEITLRSENLHGAQIVGFIHGRDVSYITIDGLDVTNPEPGDISIAQGIVFYDAHHITISNNFVHDSFGGGIAFNQSDSLLIEGNTVQGNAFFHPDAHSGISVYQPQVKENAEGEYGVIIRNNVSFENASLVPNRNCCGGNRVTDGSGIVLDDYANFQASGNGIRYSRRTLVENNLVYDNGGHGIHLFRANDADIRNNTSVNNVFALPVGSQINVSTSRDVNVYNNIASADGIDSTENAFRQPNSVNVTVQYNIFDGVLIDTPTPVDSTNLLGVDPGFVTGTFELRASSAAVDAGRDIDDPHSVDILGQDRIVGQIDIGAVERQS